MYRLRSARAALARALVHSFSSAAATAPSVPAFPLKQVIKSNFEPALAELRSHVRAADFVAIDLEMTGVTSAPWRECFEFDRSDVRYLKVKDSAEKFAVVQFGVCPFRWDSSNQFNFYIFPRQELNIDGSSSYEYLFQTSSIDFLAKYQFDFNACIHEGISYLSRRQEVDAQKRFDLEYEGESKEVRDMPVVGMVSILFSDRMKNKISEWRDRLLQFQNGESQSQGSQSYSKQQFQTIFFKMRPAISVNGFTSHQLRLIQLVIKNNFEDLSYIRVKGENCESQHLVVYTDSKHDRDLLMKEVKDEHRKQAEMKIQAAIGFRHVIDLLSSEKKLIVGHNCFLDIAHVHNKFVGPLPLEAEDFVASIHKYFPHIIDTKILLNTHPILQQRMKKSKTSLSSAFTMICPHIALSVSSAVASDSYVKVEAQVDDSRCSSWNAGGKHEAGYDAFMTGCIFAQACSYIGIDFKLHSSTENLAYNEKLQKHINHLYLSWTNADIIDLRTGNKVTETLESNPKRRFSNISFENIVLIWGFPSKLKAKDIRCCITKAFGSTSVTSVYHLDETAVFVYFSKTEFVSKFLSLKQNLERSNDDPISVLNPLAELLEGRNTHAADYETYKDICSSPMSKLLFANQAEATCSKWKKTELEETEAVVENRGYSTETASDIKSESFVDRISCDDDKCKQTADLACMPRVMRREE
uniref:Uncharacterized protein n=1 Tax=Cannabis sativa TaxID=3483 RepID=A0A803QCH9_CANSA